MYFPREPLVVRLSKLADTSRTGVLRLTGDNGGAVHLREGEIVYAESRRTPGPGRWQAHLADPGPPPPAGGGDADPATPGPGRLARIHAVREATLDAALELLSGKPRYALRQRFRESEPPAVEPASPMPLAELLTEVSRRQELVRQMATAATPLTADTPLVRVPDIEAPRVQVTALQWALLIRADGPVTPRELAWEIGNSVFATTLEVFRLIALRLLAVARPANPRTPAGWREPAEGAGGAGPHHGRPAVSFLRAVTR